MLNFVGRLSCSVAICILFIICFRECSVFKIDHKYHLVSEAYDVARGLFARGHAGYGQLRRSALLAVDTLLDLVHVMNTEMARKLRGAVIKFYKIKYFHDFANYVITLEEENPSSSPAAFPGGECIIRQAFFKQQVPLSAMTTVLASLSNNTKAQYASSFKLWWGYCGIKRIDPFDIRVCDLLDFLADCLSKGSSYGTLNNHRSALSLISRNKVGQDERVKRFLKGAFKIKPSFPKYDNTWDPNMVLNYLANMYPNNSLSLEQLTKKLVVLLALCTGQRCQTLSLIRIPNIKISSQRIVITITDIIKTSGIGRSQPKLDLPYFTQRPCVCPADTLVSYLTMTSNNRSCHDDRLILTIKKPHRPASSQTIGRWVKQILTASGIDTTIFSAHSTRHAATSAALRVGVSVDVIRKTACWSDQSATFANFYNRPLAVSDDSNFVNALLNDLPNN